MIDGRLEKGLLRLAELMAGESGPWWIIGSAAMVLAGIGGVKPDDIDVVGDGRMLRRVLARAGVAEAAAKPHLQFRSSPYTRIKADGGTDIEVQGDLELRDNGDWAPLTLRAMFKLKLAVRRFSCLILTNKR